jgi:hypothetical protein
VRHLAAAGHRRIAFLGDRSTIATARQRYAGYQEALRGLGLPLEEVGAALEDGELRELVRRQIEALDRRMEHDARLRRRLARLLESDDSDDLLATVEMMTMSEKYYTPEQQARLAERRDLLAGIPASSPRSSGCTARRAWSARRAG